MPKVKSQKKIAILGSTGSIGSQTLEVIAEYPDLFKPTVLIAGSKVDALIEQALRWRPELVVIADESKYSRLKEALVGHDIKVEAGQTAIDESMKLDIFDTVVTATVGYSGLSPTLTAIQAGKDIALANKETLVVAGDIVTKALTVSKSKILPVDSEHSAIYQCLVGEKPESVRNLVITASGGPFRTFNEEMIGRVTAKDALKHPNWNMGAKITIDSATMINKAFEIIEAHWLFNIAPEKIKAVVHPQSIVHSMVEFVDGSVKAQMGVPDMRGPIRYALGETERLETHCSDLTIDRCSTLTFEQPNIKLFPAINLGHYSLEHKGNTACIINAANEVAVSAFLQDRISFPAIYDLIRKALDKIEYIKEPTYEDYVATNFETRRYVEALVNL